MASGEGLEGVDPMGVRPMGELDAAIAKAAALPGPGQYGDVARVDPRGKSETVSSFGYHAYHEKRRQGPRRRRRASSTSSDGSDEFTGTFAAHRGDWRGASVAPRGSARSEPRCESGTPFAG